MSAEKLALRQMRCAALIALAIPAVLVAGCSSQQPPPPTQTTVATQPPPPPPPPPSRPVRGEPTGLRIPDPRSSI